MIDLILKILLLVTFLYLYSIHYYVMARGDLIPCIKKAFLQCEHGQENHIAPISLSSSPERYH